MCKHMKSILYVHVITHVCIRGHVSKLECTMELAKIKCKS